jgi:hypothetical protein
MELIQVIIIIFALFALSRAFLRFKDNALTKTEFLFWTAIWLTIIIVSFIPNLTTSVSNLFGIGRGMDLIVYISIIVLFYLIFRIYVKTESLEKNITKLIRERALDEDKAKKKEKRRIEKEP